MLLPGYFESRDPNRQSWVPTGTRKAETDALTASRLC